MNYAAAAAAVVVEAAAALCERENSGFHASINRVDQRWSLIA